MLHVDWLTAYQEHPDAPSFGSVLRVDYDPDTGEVLVEVMRGLDVSVPLVDDLPSRCSHLRIRSWGGVVEVSGNPSKWGRLEAMADGLDLDASMLLYSDLLESFGLPRFTRERFHDADGGGYRAGARFRRIDVAGCLVTGSPASMLAFFDWLPSQRYGRRGHTWGSGRESRRTYLKAGTNKRSLSVCYDKGAEVGAAAAEWRRLGERAADQAAYLQRCSEWASGVGLLRWERRLAGTWLGEHGFSWWCDWENWNMGKVLWLESLPRGGSEVGAAADWRVWADALEGYQASAKAKPLSRAAAVRLARWVLAWLNGADVRDGLSRGTFYRWAAAVRDVLSIDVRQPPDVRALSVQVRRVVELRPLASTDLPIWYKQGPGAVHVGTVTAARDRIAADLARPRPSVLEDACLAA